jgi:hypothetical protein
MYIDSLTITALVVFFIMLAVFVRFCMVKVCGMTATHKQDNHADMQRGDRS